MKVTRLLVLAVALGAGIVAAMLAVKMSNREPPPAPVTEPAVTEPVPARHRGWGGLFGRRHTPAH